MTITLEDILRTFPGSTVLPDEPFDPVSHAGKFFSALYGEYERKYPGQFLEIRLIGKRTEQSFYSSPSELLSFDLRSLLKNQEKEGVNVFFGVCPRSRKSGKNEDVRSVPALWADMDGENARKILTFKPEPDIIVYSGNGYHAYWKLNTPAPASEMTSKTLRAIQKACGSDTVSDFARIMRLPGSLNLKDPAKPKRCRVVIIGDKNNAV